MTWKLVDLQSFTDVRGSLTPLELKDFIDFAVKRMYVVHDNKTDRGGHAHIVEEELFVLVSGSCTANIHDGSDWKEIKLEANKQALYVGQMVWHGFSNFSPDGVLVALSSTNYNPNRSDYVEDFDQFLKLKTA